MLHHSCRFNGNHKLQVLKAATQSIEQMQETISRVFDCDPRQLPLARIDLAADVIGIPLDWFLERMCVPRKRRIRVFGLTRDRSRKLGGTVHFGIGADVIRLYDKASELESKSGRAASVAMTRVERQLRSGRIPPVLAKIENLWKNVTSFNPFSSIVFLSGGKSQPNIEDYSLGQYLEGTGLRQLIYTSGAAGAWNILNAGSHGNAKRKIRSLRDFLPSDADGFQIPDLFALHLESLRYQVWDQH